MDLYIKNMVCNRCILVVKQELDKLNIDTRNIILGQIQTEETISKETLDQLAGNLAALGFEMLDDSKKQLIEQIKSIVIQNIHHGATNTHQNFSDILSRALHKDYSSLSTLFSETEGITIEKFIIHQRVEKVKELIMYDELSLGEIAYKLGYSSAAYLSNQFKKVTGLTPGYFKKVGRNKRKPLDQV